MTKPKLILVDTNIAIQEAHFFRKKGGLELVSFLKASGAKLLLPEVLRSEYVKNFGELARSIRGEAEKELSKLETMWGRRLGWLLPEEGFWQQQATSILEQLDEFTVAIPQTDALLLAAALRSMENRAPCSKTDHGFKDCLIWESVLSVAAGSDLRILTRDKAFYETDKSNRLAPSMALEADALAIVVTAYNGRDQLGKEAGRSPLVALLEDLSADHKDLQLSKLSTFEPEDHPARVLPEAGHAVEATVPDLPPACDAVVVPEASSEDELTRLLTDSRDQFWRLESRVLGFIGYLDGAEKENLYDLLNQAGLDRAVAANVCERLVLAGLVRDTGNNYLPTQGRASEVAADLVEREVIPLIRKRK